MNNKTLNSTCVCNDRLAWVNDMVYMALPCEHMIHKKCMNKNKKTCEYCDEHVEKYISIHDDDINDQQFADLLSVKYYGDTTHISIPKLIDSLFDIMSLVTNLIFAADRKSGKELCERFFSMNNVSFRIFGYEKIKYESKKVFITNHVTHLDMVIMYYLFDTGFLASSFINKPGMIDKINMLADVLIIERGGNKDRKTNVVEDMKKFVDKHGSICIFPTGMLGNPDTLQRFRTGAFNIGHPIYSVTIKYRNIIYDDKMDSYLIKMAGKANFQFDIYVNGPYYPPFDQNKIEAIRMKMAKNGGLLLSRVGNRDIKDSIPTNN
jgi:1-acyl-sn-glycerol-3-phosphate acyltransferase